MDIGDIKNIMRKDLISGQKLVKSKKKYYNIKKTEEVEKDFTSSYYYNNVLYKNIVRIMIVTIKNAIIYGTKKFENI